MVAFYSIAHTSVTRFHRYRYYSNSASQVYYLYLAFPTQNSEESECLENSIILEGYYAFKYIN